MNFINLYIMLNDLKNNISEDIFIAKYDFILYSNEFVYICNNINVIDSFINITMYKLYSSQNLTIINILNKILSDIVELKNKLIEYYNNENNEYNNEHNNEYLNEYNRIILYNKDKDIDIENF